MSSAIIPVPQIDVSVREATIADVPFIDRLQKMHSDAVGFMRTAWIEEKIAKGEVIVAETGGEDRGERIEDSAGRSVPPLSSSFYPLSSSPREPVGYCMGVDRYFKRDDVGIIHQMNVVPGRQRGLVGASLLKAMFERAAYGCRLFCCWCAQDLVAANRFWEAMGFVPLAYRAGSEKKARVHIFWQKRIRAGDEQTPWWLPAKTDGGAMRADRIVLPIPPGVRWDDEMPVILRPAEAEPVRQIAGETPAPRGGKKKPLPLDAPTKHGARQFDAPPAKPMPAPAPVVAPVEKPKQGGREKKPRAKADPKMIAAARELRDRWLEQVNAGAYLFEDAGKYDVSRALPETIAKPMPQLPAA